MPARVAVIVLIAVLVLGGVAAVILTSLPAHHRRPHRPLLESIFQDDDLLLYSDAATTAHTLDELRSLGVDRLRLTILWKAIAPAPFSRRRPRAFRASDPAAYPAAAWAPYDRVVQLARDRGIAVDFNPTAPGPLWAMAAPAPSSRIADHLRPDPVQFGQFVAALGRRYDGRFIPANQTSALPRVTFWTVWNEPNQPGWLYPQWRRVSGQAVLDAPRLYRLYLDAAFSALRATGHTPASDTILFGEFAPEGREARGEAVPIPPLPFLRSLYCLDDALRPLRGAAAVLQHCPLRGAPNQFVRAHPALFESTGFAHHPYSFFLAPNVSIDQDPNFVPLSDLGRLESALDRILSGYGVDRRLPLYLTEYGYETNPPDPFRGKTLAQQAAYLDEAEYLAARDPRVRGLDQFLLRDAGPDLSYPPGSLRYWSTFQTGLRFADGRPKPALAAYRLPVFLPRTQIVSGAGLTVWAMVRPAPAGQPETATVRWRGQRAAAVTLASVRTDDPSGIVSATVTPPGSGTIQVAWTAPSGETVLSRPVAVTVTGTSAP